MTARKERPEAARGARWWRLPAAVVGGYALASGFVAVAPPLYPGPRAEALVAASVVGFLVCAWVAVVIATAASLRGGAGSLLAGLATAFVLGWLIAGAT